MNTAVAAVAVACSMNSTFASLHCILTASAGSAYSAATAAVIDLLL
jgi:hypothetical protein